jgi:formiminotetrahydrofolate cyclodeaminase
MTFAEQSIDAFLGDVASAAVTPSGGAVTAVAGASGAALCEMACLHTLGTDLDGETETELTAVGDELHSGRQRLLALADDDSAAVDRVEAALDAPDREGRDPRAAAKRATEVPLATAEACLDVVEHAEVVTAKTTPSAIADAATGAFLAYGALQGATCIVRTNLGTIQDESFVAETARRCDEVDRAAETALEQVRANVDRRN